MNALFFAVAFASLSCSAVAQPTRDEAPLPTPPAAPPPGIAGHPLNPNVSAVGLILGAAGNGSREPRTFQFKELELAFQAAVDPFARGDLFVAVAPDGAELEEGYLTWLALPGGLQAKAGKMRLDFGKFNRTHGPETPFADRPLAAEVFLGGEGLAQSGVVGSWLIMNPLDLYLNLDVAAADAPDPSQSPLFDRTLNRHLLYVGRLGTYADLTDRANVTLGISAARGPSGSTYDPFRTSSRTLHTDMLGVDLTVRWKDPARAVYRSLAWQTEWYWANRDLAKPAALSERFRAYPWGLFSYLDWQFQRRWRAGLRWDYTKTSDNVGRQAGGLLYASFDPSEFSRISIQGKRVTNELAKTEYAGFLKATFNIGPHGAHPF